jgi:hypothetical protein
VVEKPERPSSRPAPEADGGAPRPRRIEVDEKPAGRIPDRAPSRSGDSDSGNAPVVRERPTSRPAPEADGGSPRPDRSSRDTRDNDDSSDRGVRVQEREPEPQRAPEPERDPSPPSRGSQGSEDRPEVHERRPPVDRSEIQRQNERSRDDRNNGYVRPEVNPYDRPMPRSEERAPYVRPDRVERSEPYVRPEPRPESRSSQPAYRAPESRPEPRVEQRSQPERRSEPERSSRGNDSGSSSRDRGDRGSRGNDRPQVRERRPPAE